MKLIRLFVVLLFFGTASSILAQVTLTAATGGTNISIDNTSTGGTGTWSTLTGPVIAEVTLGDINTGVHTLTLPAGWEFNTGQVVTITIDGIGTELALASTSITPDATSLSFNVTVASSSVLGGLTFSDIEVRPTGTTAPTTGNITLTVGAINGIDGASNFGTLSTIHGAATKYVIVNPVDGTVDAAIAITVQLQDQFNNVVTTGVDKDKDVTLNTDGSATGDGLVDIVNGVGTINISDHVAETVNLSLTDTEVTGFNIVSTQNVVFTHGVANKYVIINPADGTVDAVIAVTVQLQDQYNNVVITGADKDKDVTLNADGSTTGDGLVDIVNGVGTKNISDHVAETVNLSLTDSEGTGFNITSTQNVIFANGVANKYIVTSSNYSPVAGTGVTISAQLADQYNNAVSTAGNVVTWTKSDSHGSFATPTSATNGSGIATVMFTTYTVVGTTTTVTGTTGALTGTSPIITTIAPLPTLSSPANYTVGISVLPTFDWVAVVGATNYDVEISTDGSTFSVIAAGTGRPYTTTEFHQLTSGTLYYWRVKINGGDYNGQYSQPWEFTTQNGLVTISTYFASATSAYITWYLLPASSNVKYDLYYSVNADMSGYSSVSDLTNTYYTLTDLTPGIPYYILVKAKNNAGTVIINYSAIVTFTTPALASPTLSYPITGATTYSNPPYLYWYTGTYDATVEYEVKYWNSAVVGEPGALVAQDADKGYFETNSPNMFTLLTATLTAGETYNWEVRTKSGLNYSAWSATETFVIYSTTPATAPTPYPSWPVGGYDSYINPPTLYWYTGTYATGLFFQVEWDNDDELAVDYLDHSDWTSNLYFAVPTALTADTYVWRVRSRIGAGPATSGWSDVVSFVIPSTTSSVSVPYPTSPIGTVVTTLNPTLSWFAVTPPALTYKIRISPYSNTDGTGMLSHATAKQTNDWIGSLSSTFSALNFDAPEFTLVAGATYYWQVKAKNASDVESSWSWVASFSTSAGALSIVPFVVSPIEGQPINSTSAILSWALPSEPQAHLKYDVEYSKSENFNSVMAIKDINEPFTKIDGLDQNSKYYWRVYSKNNSGSQSMYSATGSFRTNSITGIEHGNQEVPSKFSLEQNYPNPFNPSTYITYSLPTNSFVTLKIYDMLGREVRTLVNQNMNAGNITTVWNGTDNNGYSVASGTYIYRLTAENFISTKKMLFIK